MMLADKAIIVTGSTTGIGEAIARRCVAEGARVLVHGRDRARGQEVVDDLGGGAILHVDDLADPAAPGRLVQAAMAGFGRIDGVVNNAAWPARSNIENTSAEHFDRVMAINVRAPLLLVQAALAELRRSRGVVVNIGSINGYCGEPNLLDYSVSKGALMTLSRNLADSLAGQGVRVIHFNVGWVLTENEYQLKLKEGLPADWPQRVSAAFAPSGRLIEPSTIAGAVVYWLSDESRPISGSVVELEQYPVIGRNPHKD